MRTIVVYESTDGSRWDSAEDAQRRDELDAAVRAIEARCPKPPHRGRVKVDPEQMRAAKHDTVALCREQWPREAIFQHDADEIHTFSYAGRFLSEVGGPLNRIWFVFMCWNGEWLYEQAHFALNPEKFVDQGVA